MMPQPKIMMEWSAHEHEHKTRNADWFWAVGILSVSIAVAAVIFGNIIIGILVLVGTFSLSLFINQLPDTIRIAVDEKGITRNKIYYPYASLESFWIDIEHSYPKIILKSQKMFMPLIVVPIGKEVDVEKLHENLSNHLREEYHALPFVERLLEYVGF